MDRSNWKPAPLYRNRLDVDIETVNFDPTIFEESNDTSVEDLLKESYQYLKVKNQKIIITKKIKDLSILDFYKFYELKIISGIKRIIKKNDPSRIIVDYYPKLKVGVNNV